MFKSFDKLQNDADQLLRVWSANPAFALDNVTLEAFQSLVTSFKDSCSKMEDLRTQLVKNSNDTRKMAKSLEGTVRRARTGIRGFFGPDSSQYEQIGGVTTTQRRSRRSKPAVQVPPPTAAASQPAASQPAAM